MTSRFSFSGEKPEFTISRMSAVAEPYSLSRLLPHM